MNINNISGKYVPLQAAASHPQLKMDSQIQQPGARGQNSSLTIKNDNWGLGTRHRRIFAAVSGGACFLSHFCTFRHSVALAFRSQDGNNWKMAW